MCGARTPPTAGSEAHRPCAKRIRRRSSSKRTGATSLGLPSTQTVRSLFSASSLIPSTRFQPTRSRPPRAPASLRVHTYPRGPLGETLSTAAGPPACSSAIDVDVRERRSRRLPRRRRSPARVPGDRPVDSARAEPGGRRAGAVGLRRRPKALAERADVGLGGAHHELRCVNARVAPAFERSPVTQSFMRAGGRARPSSRTASPRAGRELTGRR